MSCYLFDLWLWTIFSSRIKLNCCNLAGDRNEEKEKEIKQEFGQTCDWIKKRLGDKVASVQISNRLNASPCVLVSRKFGWSANMERLMKAQTTGDTSSLDFMRSRRVFEINPNHPIIKDLHVRHFEKPLNTISDLMVLAFARCTAY